MRGKEHQKTYAMMMPEKIIAKAESFPGIKAGIARPDDVLNSPSYHAAENEAWMQHVSHNGSMTNWSLKAQSVIVLGLHHPEDAPHLDWWELGNTLGNHRLIEVSTLLKQWLRAQYGIGAYPLPYSVEKGGVFLKDAAVAAGLGIIGRNNLLIHPEWGPRIRLRAILIEAKLTPTTALETFSPCETCQRPCYAACPQQAFSTGVYNRSKCMIQMNLDEEHKAPAGETDKHGRPVLRVKYCRACELACPIGR